jgi:parvulin-like peptidyl-prolyl isomerase
MKKALLVILVAATAATASAADMVEAIIVRVGDRIVTRTQYLKRLEDGYVEIEQTSKPEEIAAKKVALQKNMVNDIISELLLKDRADRLGITVTQDDINMAMARLKEQYGISSDEQFVESLKKSGMTRADMEARLRDTILMNKVFGRELHSREDASDKELRERYEREKERYRLPERAHLREIVLLRPANAAQVDAVRQRAESIATEAKTGDFAALAASTSESGTRNKGGDLGEVARGELLADLDKAVFNSPSGTVIGPIESKSGFHIIKVEQRLPSEVPAFESIKDKLRRDASDESWQRDYKAYIDNLRKDAFIQIHEENVPSS